MFRLYSQKYWKERNIPFHFEFRDTQAPFPLHNHDFHEVFIVYSGSATHITGEGMYELEAGDVCSIKPNQSHGFKSVKNLILMNILVKPSFFQEEMYDLQSIQGYAALFEPVREVEKSPIARFRLNKTQLREVSALIEAMQQEITNKHAGYEALATSLFYQLIIYFLRVIIDKNFSSSSANTAASYLIEYVNKNYKKSIPIQELKEISGMSESSILRTFRRITGYPPSVYQNRLRMFSAADRLSQTQQSVTEIAYDLGFEDSNYFSRMFKKFLSLSPTEYREHYS